MKPITHILSGVVLAMLSVLSVQGQSRVEYFWDTDPGVGAGQVLQSFSGSSLTASAELDVSGLAPGIHQLGLRALNDGYFSATYYRSIYVPVESERITRIEYSWDTAAAAGKGTALSFTAGSAIDLTTTLSTKALAPGIHTLYLRTLSTHHASALYARNFFVPATPHAVEAVEYFFDTDPGVGRATRLSATTDGGSLTKAFDVSTSGLADGIHHIGIRTLTDATWSATYTRQFLVRSQVDNYITSVEYFWDQDPGEGNGIVVDITPGEEVDVDFLADMYLLPEGTHTLGIRARTGSGGSSTSLVKDIEFEGWDALQEYIYSLEDTQDSFSGNVYQRDVRNLHWQPLYVPFALSYSDWSAHFEVARINAFYQYDDDEDGVVDRQVLEAITVRPGNGDLKPNHPYLIRAKSTGKHTIKVDPAKVVAPQINSVSCSTMEAVYTFTGNYSDLTGLHSADRYRVKGDHFSVPPTDDEVLPPYRWYITIDDLGNQLEASANSVYLRIIGEDEPTGIDDTLVANDEPVGARPVFDLQGRRVMVSPETTLRQLPRGVYIVAGKKLIVK